MPESTPDATVTAGLVVIGNEILSGRTKDVNVAYLARQLTALGIQLAEVRMVRDEERAIIAAVNTLRASHNYVFTTGGIGPTHDDITCEAVARAFNLPYRIHPEAKRILEDFYRDTGRELNEARMRMAHTPEGATLIENPVSRAPGFRVENVHVLAGIPAVMRAMFESVAPTLKGGRTVRSREIAVLLGEGDVAAAARRSAGALPGAGDRQLPLRPRRQLRHDAGPARHGRGGNHARRRRALHHPAGARRRARAAPGAPGARGLERSRFARKRSDSLSLTAAGLRPAPPRGRRIRGGPRSRPVASPSRTASP